MQGGFNQDLAELLRSESESDWLGPRFLAYSWAMQLNQTRLIVSDSPRNRIFELVSDDCKLEAFQAGTLADSDFCRLAALQNWKIADSEPRRLGFFADLQPCKFGAL